MKTRRSSNASRPRPGASPGFPADAPSRRFFRFSFFPDGTRRTDASRSEPFRVSMTLRAAMLTCVASGAYASPHTPANTAGSESSNASSKNAGGTSRSGSSAAAAAAADPEPASLSAVRPRGAGSGSEENAGRREDEPRGGRIRPPDSTFARSPPAPAPSSASFGGTGRNPRGAPREARRVRSGVASARRAPPPPTPTPPTERPAYARMEDHEPSDEYVASWPRPRRRRASGRHLVGDANAKLRLRLGGHADRRVAVRRAAPYGSPGVVSAADAIARGSPHRAPATSHARDATNDVCVISAPAEGCRLEESPLKLPSA